MCLACNTSTKLCERFVIALAYASYGQNRETFHFENFADDEASDPHNPTTATNIVFLGTSIVSGTATAVVTATGRATSFGDIVAHLEYRPPETEFERGIKH